MKCEGRVDSVDEELLRKMRRAGCRVVAYGVESGNRASLSLLRKDIDLNQTIAAFAATRAAGVRSLAYIILGVPGEDELMFDKPCDFVEKIGADYAQFSTLNPTPGTPIYSLQNPANPLRDPLDSNLPNGFIGYSARASTTLNARGVVGFYLRPNTLSDCCRCVPFGFIERRRTHCRSDWALGCTGLNVQLDVL